MAGKIERHPEQRRTERIAPSRATSAERRVLVSKIEIAVDDQRPQLNEVLTPVGTRPLVAPVKEADQHQQECDETKARRVERRQTPFGRQSAL